MSRQLDVIKRADDARSWIKQNNVHWKVYYLGSMGKPLTYPSALIEYVAPPIFGFGWFFFGLFSWIGILFVEEFFGILGNRIMEAILLSPFWILAALSFIGEHAQYVHGDLKIRYDAGLDGTFRVYFRDRVVCRMTMGYQHWGEHRPDWYNDRDIKFCLVAEDWLQSLNQAFEEECERRAQLRHERETHEAAKIVGAMKI